MMNMNDRATTDFTARKLTKLFHILGDINVWQFFFSLSWDVILNVIVNFQINNLFQQEFAKTLGKRAVAYLNVDISVQGNYTFRAKSTPNLFSAIYEATKQVPDVPLPGHMDTVYDTWAKRKPWSSENPLP